MMEYLGLHGLKEHIHGKPIRFGYRIWSLYTSSGYLIEAKPYQGPNTGNFVLELEMGGSVVVDLNSELPTKGLEYSLFFDNLLSLLSLHDHLI